MAFQKKGSPTTCESCIGTLSTFLVPPILESQRVSTRSHPKKIKCIIHLIELKDLIGDNGDYSFSCVWSSLPIAKVAGGEGTAVCYVNLLWEQINEYYAPDSP